MESLSDETLIEAYLKTKELNLDQDFLDLIKTEMNHRTLTQD